MRNVSKRCTYSCARIASVESAAWAPVTDYVERRRMARIALPFPARMRGSDVAGRRFDTETVLDNLSANGLYLRLMRRVVPGTRVFVVIRLAVGSAAQQMKPRLAANGLVSRAEPQSGGEWGLGVRLTRHRFL